MVKIFIIQNVPHENLGILENVFISKDFSLHYFDPPKLLSFDATSFNYDALIMMGGPMSVYDTTEFPHLIRAAQLIRMAHAAGKPILGICLGAQMIAKAFDARVRKNPVKEIGWYPLALNESALTDPLFKGYKNQETVFQWHGDTFDLPEGATLLASSPLCRNQAFRLGDNIFGLQFHVEVSEVMINEWLDEEGNKAELESLKVEINSDDIKKMTPQHITRLNQLCQYIGNAFMELVNAANDRICD